MKRWLALTLTLFLHGTMAWAAGPILPQIFTSPGGEQSRAIDVVPDPANLRADWFRYFAVKPDELATRVNTAKLLLDRRYGVTGQEAGSGDGIRMVNRIKANLDAFAKASSLRDPQNLPSPEVLDRYTPGQALSLVKALRKARQDLRYERNDTDALESRVDDALRQSDQQMVAYLQIGVGNPARVDAGMEIMAERTAAVTSQLQLRLRYRALEIREGQLNELARAEAVAERRLTASPGEITRLEEQIKALEPELEESYARVFNERRRVLESNADTLEDEIAARYRQQRATNASVVFETANLRLESLKMQRDLAVMLATPEVADFGAIRARMTDFNARLEQIRQSLDQWLTASERERDRAGALLSTADQGPTLQTTVRLMNQDRLRLAQETVSAVSVLSSEITQLEFLTRWTTRAVTDNEGPIARAIGTMSASASAAGTWLSGITDRSLFKLGETPITLAGLFKVVMIVLLSWVFSWMFRRILVNVGHRFENESQSLVFIISRLSHYLIILIGLIAGLSSIGLNFTN
ncbi:MAG: hypothetical protein WBD51_02580, partial [Burkholderiaceae bacterium]